MENFFATTEPCGKLEILANKKEEEWNNVSGLFWVIPYSGNFQYKLWAFCKLNVDYPYWLWESHIHAIGFALFAQICTSVFPIHIT